MYTPLFSSFIQAGFECSTHKNGSGKRLDLTASTLHEKHLASDFQTVQKFGMRTVREGVRWHLVEPQPGHYDFSSLEQLFDAAAQTGTEVLLDLLHFGWPDYLDIFGPRFVPAFTELTHQVISFLKQRGISRPFLAPVNEISFLTWGAADAGFLFPHAQGRGPELKRILVKAAICAAALIRQELPQARLLWPEPVIHIVGEPEVLGSVPEAERYRLAQYEAWDMVAGTRAPELGGRPEYLDIIGVNFYNRNQWVHNVPGWLSRSDARYRHFHQMLQEVWNRYHRPIFISETGTEDDERADWFRYIGGEVLQAQASGVPVHGICWYPILNHPGWEDDRHCCNGLLDYADEHGNRPVHQPLAEAIVAFQNSQAFCGLDRKNQHDPTHDRPHLLFSSALELRLSKAAAPDESLCSS
jgi:hypothetical protein